MASAWRSLATFLSTSSTSACMPSAIAAAFMPDTPAPSTTTLAAYTPDTPPISTPRPPPSRCRWCAPTCGAIRPAPSDIGASSGSDLSGCWTVSYAIEVTPAPSSASVQALEAARGREVKSTCPERIRWYSSSIGSLTLRIRSPSPHTSSAVGRIFAPAVVKSSSGIDDPFPAPASMSTWWPPRADSCTPAGVIAPRYSWFLISRGIPTFMAVLPDCGASFLFRGIRGGEPLIPLSPRSIPRQYGQGRDPVVQLTGEDLAHRLVERQPGRHELGLLALRHEV